MRKNIGTDLLLLLVLDQIAAFWFSCKSSMDSCNMFPKRCKIGLGDVGTSSAISKNDYEVLLSFRGPDTRQGFTDCLYHALIDSGIRVFRDDDELPLGCKIDEILTALHNSKICILVLSPTFAESVWCLREVERMVDMNKHIVPIFYQVTPDDVKLKSELYANALTVHETKHGKQQVQQWSDALKEIATIKGRELKTSGFVEFSRQIAKEILTKLKVKHKYEIVNFVQVSDEVEEALKLLDVGSGGCRFLGIHGMGGIGKTTLSKIIFNQISDSFDCSCFLENIRESLSQGQGHLHILQQQLLRSLDPSLRDATHIVDAMEKIKHNFTRKKVIIVLDDIDNKNHIRDLVGSFGIGSRIIFTTRNAEIHEQGTSSDAHFYGLEKKTMDSKQALKLFSRHAFGEDSPPKDFKSLSTEAISTTGGLPLALELVGSFLRRRKAKVWKDMIKKLKEAPHQDVQRKLKLSYDALDDEQQEIFLDIACFFIGVEKSYAVYMWEACDFDPNYGIEVLISMSLIKLNDKYFWMHDQLRDLGRAIVKVNSKDARAGSRLWKHKDALHLLKTNVGKEKVEAVHLNEFDEPFASLNHEILVGLEKLRYLRLRQRVNFGGNCGKLRWLSLSLLDASSFSVTNLWLRELVVLELSYCSFDETWQGWGQMLISKQLKVLTLSNCHELTSTPDLSKIVNLERLVLQNCRKLIFVHSSIEKLHCLRRLSITGCNSLHDLPESIRRLVSLTRLQLESVVNLPSSIGELVKLRHLSLRESRNLRVLPDSIGDLRSLISLDLSSSGITELPTTIGRLAKLEYLCLLRCKCLQRLPDSIGSLHSLIDLNMRSSSIVELPDSFRGLEKLQRLDIGDFTGRYWIRELPELPSGLTWLSITYVQKICNLSNLLNLSWLKIDNSLFVALEGIEKLINLEQLYIHGPIVEYLSMEYWGALQQLKSLELHCPNLEFQKCHLPSSLKSLHLGAKRWGQMPINVSSLKNLTELKLYNFVAEEADLVQGLESLEVLDMRNCILKFKDFGMLKRLRDLSLNRCCSHVGASPPADDLQDRVSRIRSELQIELCNLKNLSRLELSGFSIHDDGFKVEGLESLVELSICDCIIHVFANATSVLTSLTSICLSGCSFPTMACLDIPQLNCLVELNIQHCRDLVNIQSIGKLKSLTKLWILECDSLQKIGDLSELNGLTHIKIYNCCEFQGIDCIDKLRSAGTLSELDIHRCKCDSVFYSSTLKYII